MVAVVVGATAEGMVEGEAGEVTEDAVAVVAVGATVVVGLIQGIDQKDFTCCLQ